MERWYEIFIFKTIIVLFSMLHAASNCELTQKTTFLKNVFTVYYITAKDEKGLSGTASLVLFRSSESAMVIAANIKHRWSDSSPASY